MFIPKNSLLTLLRDPQDSHYLNYLDLRGLTHLHPRPGPRQLYQSEIKETQLFGNPTSTTPN